MLFLPRSSVLVPDFGVKVSLAHAFGLLKSVSIVRKRSTSSLMIFANSLSKFAFVRSSSAARSAALSGTPSMLPLMFTAPLNAAG